MKYITHTLLCMLAMALHASGLTLTSDSNNYPSVSSITVSWTAGSGNGKDWIGLYSAGVTPGSQHAIEWAYIGGTQSSTANGPTDGSVTFTNVSLAAGSYSLYYLSNDTYNIAAGPTSFSVSNAPTVSTNKSSYTSGETITVSYANGPANDADWIGVYLNGQTPGQGAASSFWAYTNGTQTAGSGSASGSVDFTNPGLAAGNYSVFFLENDGFTVLSGPYNFSVVQGSGGGPSVTTNKSSYAYDETITVDFAGGPANDADWIAVYPSGQTPGVGGYALWLYTNGTTSTGGGSSSGTIYFSSPGLSPGNYDIYFLENNGYTVLSGPSTITVESQAGPALPKWAVSTFRRVHGVVGNAYVGKIGAYAADPDAGDTLSFSLVSGPSWLSVASNGTLSGTPASGDVGTNTFVVRATDLGNNSADATMTIKVFASGAEAVSQIKVLSYNLWHGFGKINNGHRKGLESIIQSDADIIGTQETVDNVSGSNVFQAQAVAEALGWHWSPVSGDSGIISRYPITEEFSAGIANGIKVELTASPKKEVILYNCHLDYLHYGPYAAQLSGATSKKVLREEKKSQRDEEIADIISNMSAHLNNANNIPVILTGDFNAPSHLDWTSATASSHGGVGYVAWPTSLACVNAGLLDSFRMIHPNPANTPGNTWSPLFKGSEAQDRIDFVYYKGHGLTVTDSQVYVKAVEVTLGAWGSSITPALNNTWPSDHSAVLSTFTVADQ
ncbi:hypothetical protein NT6N_32160 [Oceaniferula spumae]|uniref:Dystroglycan-type cadherin-like domain-containing protein n=1 Tax=Oceaniferula spumae TaxID=2979115 RepID=A0AAT9FQK9_9BACT